jgi:hypothetical protein
MFNTERTTLSRIRLAGLVAALLSLAPCAGALLVPV